MLFKTVFPLMFQSFMLSSLNFVNQVMVGKLGIESIAAVGAANKIYSLFYLVLYGTCSACVMFVAQYSGKGDLENLRKTMGMCFTITLSFGLLVTLATTIFPGQCIGIFIDEPKVVEYGAEYLRYVSLSYFILGLVYPINFMLRGTREVIIVTLSTGGAFIMNIITNYAFIFGKLGMPELGVRGAALGTVLTRGTELAILIIYLAWTRNRIMGSVSALFGYRGADMKVFLSKALPLAGNEFLWGIGTSIYFIIYGGLGLAEFSAMSIINTLQMLVQTFALSLAGSCAIIVGNEIGSGNYDRVFDYTRKFHRLAVIVGLMSSAVLLCLMTPILEIYDVRGTQAGVYVRQCLLILSGFMVINAFNTMNVEGIFRSGGDVKYVMLMDMGGIWLVGLPLTFIAGVLLKLDVTLVYAVFIIVELYKVPLGIKRYRSGKWMNRLKLESNRHNIKIEEYEKRI